MSTAVGCCRRRKPAASVAGFYYNQRHSCSRREVGDCWQKGEEVVLRDFPAHHCSHIHCTALNFPLTKSLSSGLFWIITGKWRHGEFVHTSVGDSKFLLLIFNVIYRLETPILHSIIFANEREKMDAFRAPENESLLPSSSGSARWDPFHRPLDSIQPWHFRLLAAVMLVVTSLSLAENLAVILVTFKFKQLRQPVNYVIVNLSVADFLVSLTGGIISFLTNLKGYFYMGYWACVLEGFAVTFFGKLDFVYSCMFFPSLSFNVFQ